ncbi:hypothetical protein DOY81_004377 [Sarcophaga bullata]|nr:hypothetical protein DOY81_004377 [Sarcophaga bullata]
MNEIKAHNMASAASTKSTTSSSGSNRWSILNRHTTTTTPTSQQSNAWNNNNNNTFSNNNNTLSIKSLNLPKDDGTLVYRRKSSGSTPHGSAGNTSTAQTTQYCGGGSGTPDTATPTGNINSGPDEFECYAADGSVLLRIPAPHVVAARAYRLASKKRTSSIFTSGAGGASGGGGGSSGGSSTSTSDNNTRCSGNNTPTLDSGCQIPGFSGCASAVSSSDANNATSHTPTTGFSISSSASMTAGGTSAATAASKSSHPCSKSNYDENVHKKKVHKF